MAATVKTWTNNSPPQCEDDDLNGFKSENNNLISSAGLILNTSDNTQTGKAVAEYVSYNGNYGDTGTANSYVLYMPNAMYTPAAYVDGMLVRFRPLNPNTGASTVNLLGLGVKTIGKGTAGVVSLVEGDIRGGYEIHLVFDTPTDKFILTNPPDTATTGDLTPSFAVSKLGWVLMDDKSIGSLASAATGRASDDTEDLFTLMWSVPDTWCPVSGGRGASAAADFAANKTLTLPRALGRALGAAGHGSGLSSRALGEYTGVETHILVTSEMPNHLHRVWAGSATSSDCYMMSNGAKTIGGTNRTDGQQWYTNFGETGHPILETTGGGAAHTNMQPSVFTHWFIKL